jgi:tRNA threonylcarbamoyladenosine biosynthesis protein TsaE
LRDSVYTKTGFIDRSGEIERSSRVKTPVSLVLGGPAEIGPYPKPFMNPLSESSHESDADLIGGTTPLEFTTHSPEETIALGRTLAPLLTPPKLVVLRGELGAGKTTLVKGIAEGFHAASQEDVTSPTFTLVHEYRGPEANLFHVDLYRIETASALETLGLDDFMGGNNLLLIEWGEKFPRFERERDVEIALERIGEDERRIQVTACQG